MTDDQRATLVLGEEHDDERAEHAVDSLGLAVLQEEAARLIDEQLVQVGDDVVVEAQRIDHGLPDPL